mmetsp:Transcript_33379/g.131451  ORF Transcript_33379/g.131451 Transcript_33379/m.131451 type:complete len:263 (+) Transcript_33379:6441-7229(+)
MLRTLRLGFVHNFLNQALCHLRFRRSANNCHKLLPIRVDLVVVHHNRCFATFLQLLDNLPPRADDHPNAIKGHPNINIHCTWERLRSRFGLVVQDPGHLFLNQRRRSLYLLLTTAHKKRSSLAGCCSFCPIHLYKSPGPVHKLLDGLPTFANNKSDCLFRYWYACFCRICMHTSPLKPWIRSCHVRRCNRRCFSGVSLLVVLGNFRGYLKAPFPWNRFLLSWPNVRSYCCRLSPLSGGHLTVSNRPLTSPVGSFLPSSPYFF